MGFNTYEFKHFVLLMFKKNVTMEKVYSVHCIQHVPYEGAGYIEKWAKDKGYAFSVSNIYEEGMQLPLVSDFEMLIVMGGPMGAYEEDVYPWLKREKKFVQEAIALGKIVVGICLGSQIIANVLGASVYPHKEKEIGWLPISFANKAAQSLFGGKDMSPIVFQWHGDTFDLPHGANLLASSEICANQAFLYKETVVGLQFHLEVTEKSCTDILDNSQENIIEGKSAQSREFIRANTHNIPECNRMITNLLNKLTGI